MNRKDFAPLILLIGLFMLWPFVGPELEKRFFPRPPAEAGPAAEPARDPGAAEPAPAVQAATPPGPPAESPVPAPPPTPAPVQIGAATGLPVPDRGPEEVITLTNQVATVTLSSWGATVRGAIMHAYQATLTNRDEVVTFDFDGDGVLAYLGLAGLGLETGFAVEADPNGRTVVFRATSPAGLSLTRTVTLDRAHLLAVTDHLTNPTGLPILLPEHRIGLGAMSNPGASKSLYVPYSVGVDVLPVGGKGVEYLGKKYLPRALKRSGDLEVREQYRAPVEWVAVKNRFFVQILRLKDVGADDAIAIGRRGEKKAKVIDEAAAEALFHGMNLAAGETLAREFAYYVGPKNYGIIRNYRFEQDKVMEFGLFTPICKILLQVINLIHNHVWPHSYGLAIMLVTILIRVVFWPITHAGTVNMKKMQDVAPLMQEIKEKHKDSPQKQQEAMLALYKEHKVNPVGGCLPMLIQIPVFFALFVVLRSAIELRFAGFLWIRDLSQPEGLFASFLPFGGLNLLPIFMAGSMLLQQKIMPTSADPRQAKIMQFMPIMMLVMFYPAPSGLALYWTTNQSLMIAQQYLYKRKKDRQAEAEKS